MRIHLLFLLLSYVWIALVSAQESKANLNDALEESEILKLLRDQAEQHDKKLDNLNRRLNKELHAMEQHFSEMFDTIKATEKTLEDNLREVETSVYGSVKEVDKARRANSTSWIWPFVSLVVFVAAAGGFFVYMYNKATSHAHYL